MIIFPAIDIKDGKVVRLFQGKFDEVTEYSGDPVQVAKKWQEQGAQWLHVVDLDGAKTGKMHNSGVITEIAQGIDIPIQVGGGIRTRDDIRRLIDGGVARVVLGTKVIEDKDFLQGVLTTWEKGITVSLDCADGFLAQRGWVEKSDIRATDFVKALVGLNLDCFIYTDIARDGTLTGPNMEGLKSLLAATDIPVIASGGIASLEDVRKLAALEPQGLLGAIIGKAIYEGKINLEDAIQLCSPRG